MIDWAVQNPGYTFLIIFFALCVLDSIFKKD